MNSFKPGQRWTSETEPELGLGTILAAEGRQVTVAFTASDEVRQYAAHSAPLERAMFRVGDTVVPSRGESFTVKAVEENNGLFTYINGKIELPETLLSDTLPAGHPEDGILKGQSGPPEHYTLRMEAWRHRARIHSAPVRGFVGARIDLIPHQLYIAAKAAERMAPRILLADEVGLGKTIEACLILHRLLITGRVHRALILVPEALMHQWFVELLRRFNLSVSLFDEERCVAASPSSPSNNPFLSEQWVLTSTDFFERHENRRHQALAAGWDLLIIDEAHHLAWSPEAPSVLYNFAFDLARTVPGVLLLTATPEELGPESHFARLQLLDPDRYTNLNRFYEESKGYAATAKEADTLLKKGKPIDELLDRYGPGRVMFRNARRTMEGFPERKAILAPLDPDTSRCAWLAELLRKLKGEKIVLIASSRKSILELNEELTRHIQAKVALFHEEMEIIQRDRSAAWFAEEDGARILLCSEIGGEGRNFQFAHHLVLYDLPENPEVLEQRIGRLDRIGQRETVHIHVPYVKGGPEEQRVRWLHEGLEAFEHCLQGGMEIYRTFRDELDGEIEPLLRKTKAFRKKLYARLEAGANRLLELHSFDPAEADRIVDGIRKQDHDAELEPFLLDLLDYFGIHAEEIDRQTWQLVPGHTFRDGLPGFSKEGMIVTLSRTKALDREDWNFLTWDHPLVTGAMDQLLGSGEGTGTIVQDTGSLEGGLVIEAVFVLEVTAPPALESDRFLPAVPIRVACDLQLEDVRTHLPLDLPDGRLMSLPLDDEYLVQRIHDMLDACRERAEKEADKLRREARKKMRESLGKERDRLEYLSRVNDHVRPEELEQIDEKMEKLGQFFAEANPRLDAVRLIGRDLRSDFS